jgi:transcriptional regulator with XRE-family HTH domain
MFLTESDLLRLRKKAKLSQAAVAQKIGVDRRTIANWEQGMGSPSFNQVVKLCMICSMDILLFVSLVLARENDSKPLNLDKAKKSQ